ncbi:hypothetical protein [Paenibacillus sp. FSL K6-1230]|uniref:hypothetical protein n=1 Tax=Paenibacillus sp. FSL K6-1230 TaxID=2921603 RepID=UPI0030FA7533
MSKDIKFWRYYFPSIDGVEGWGIITIDSTGVFSAVTGGKPFLMTMTITTQD